MLFHRKLCLFQTFFSSTWATSIFHFKWVLPFPVKIHLFKIFTKATSGSSYMCSYIFLFYRPFKLSRPQRLTRPARHTSVITPRCQGPMSPFPCQTALQQTIKLWSESIKPFKKVGSQTEFLSTSRMNCKQGFYNHINKVHVSYFLRCPSSSGNSVQPPESVLASLCTEINNKARLTALSSSGLFLTEILLANWGS